MATFNSCVSSPEGKELKKEWNTTGPSNGPENHQVLLETHLLAPLTGGVELLLARKLSDHEKCVAGKSTVDDLSSCTINRHG